MMHHNHQQGIILVPTMSILMIMTMLVITLMKSMFIYSKINNQLAKKDKAFYELEGAAYFLASKSRESTSSDCIYSETDPNLMVSLLHQHIGCQLTMNHQAYQYLIDDLGTYPCLRVVIANKIYSTHHRFITISSTESPEDILQIRVATPSMAVRCESLTPKYIKTGITSWRYVSNAGV